MKKIFTIIVMLIAFGTARAEFFIIDSIEYYLSYPAATEVDASHYLGHAANVVIPSSVTYNGRTYQVTTLGCSGDGFRDNIYIENVTIPNTITAIGGFRNCISLSNITIPNSVTIINNWCFAGSGLTSIVIPNSIVQLYEYTFKDCTSLESITIPSSVKMIERECFSGCTSLDTIYYLGNTKDRAFIGCTNLVYAYIEGSVGDECFKNCVSLQYASVHHSSVNGYYYSPNTLRDKVFEGCVNLNKMVLGEQIHYLSYYSFYGCGSPDTIQITIPQSYPLFTNDGWGQNHLENLFDIDVNTTILVVPCNKRETYENRDPWMYFWNIIEDCSGVDTTSTDTTSTDTTGIYDVRNPENAIIYAYEGRVYLHNSNGTDGIVYDVNGRQMDVIKSGCPSVPLPRGIYLVKVGTLPARKVLIIR